MKAFVTACSPYEFPDKDGKVIKGGSLWILDQKTEQGNKPSKQTVSLELAQSLDGKLPAFVELETEQKFTAKKIELVIKNVKIIKQVDIFSLAQ